jgi:hypothetical protein
MWVYPALGYVKARNVFFEVQKEKDGRAFIVALADIVILPPHGERMPPILKVYHGPRRQQIYRFPTMG